MFKGIDLYSDTMTRPSEGMRQAIAAAEVGNEQELEGDPTTLKLEARVAELLGFERGLFLPSATLANQIAVQLHCQRGDTVLAADSSHLFTAEGGAPAAYAGVMTLPIPTKDGTFQSTDLVQTFQPCEGPHDPFPQLLSVENTTNMGGGVAWPFSQLKDVISTARSLGLKVHLDGARLLNAATRCNVPPREISAGFDTATLCLSKGLGCPTGAVLVLKSSDFLKARRLKQRMGGAMRQSGILSAAGLYALDHHLHQFEKDHQHATRLAELLNNLPGIQLENPFPSTNMVFFHWISPNLSAEHFLERCIQKGVRFSRAGKNRFRAVTHLDIKESDIETAGQVVRKICEQR